MTLAGCESICRVQDPLDWTPEKADLMVAACAELAAFHYEASAELRHIYDRWYFSPASIRSERDITRIPPITVSAMKRYLLLSRPEAQAVLKMTSSGTRGQKTQIWMDAESLARGQAMLDGLWSQEQMTSTTKTNYLMFVYDPNDAADLGLAFSCQNEQRFAPVKESYYAIRKDGHGDWVFDKEGVYQKAREFAEQGAPVRILGMPGFLHELVSEYRSRGPLHFPETSLVMTGGGWKAAEDKMITREQFRAEITRFFGIPDHRIRDGYGMAEHGAPYNDCTAHRFHVPAYCRVIVRDPVTLEALPAGQTGLLELVCPYNTMMPNLAVLSTDWGSIDEAPCTCGHNAPTFTLAGRAGLTKLKGCALTANEVVRR